MAAWLWTQSSLHTDWTVQLMELTIWPAIRHRQFLLGRDKNGRPVVYVSWAKLDEERERRYLRNPSSLDIHEWNTGDQVWFVDWIAPFGGSRVAARKIQNDIFPNDTGHSLHVKKGRTQARIYDHFGINVTRERKRAAVEALQRNLRTAFSC
jgi:cytolysin-activating lysine-acyltransferase